MKLSMVLKAITIALSVAWMNGQARPEECKLKLPAKTPIVPIQDQAHDVMVTIAEAIINKVSEKSHEEIVEIRKISGPIVEKFLMGQMDGSELFNALWRLLVTLHPTTISIVAIPLVGAIIALVSCIAMASCRSCGNCQYIKQEPEYSYGYITFAFFLGLIALAWGLCFSVLVENMRLTNRAHEVVNTTVRQIDVFNNFFAQASQTVECIRGKTKQFETEVGMRRMRLERLYKIINNSHTRAINENYGTHVSSYAKEFEKSGLDMTTGSLVNTFKQLGSKCKNIRSEIAVRAKQLSDDINDISQFLIRTINGNNTVLPAWEEFMKNQFRSVEENITASIMMIPQTIETAKLAEKEYQIIHEELAEKVAIISSNSFASEFDDAKILYSRLLQVIINNQVALVVAFLVMMVLYASVALIGYTPRRGMGSKPGFILGSGAFGVFFIAACVDVAAILFFVLGFGGHAFVCEPSTDQLPPIAKVIPMKQLNSKDVDALKKCINGESFQQAFAMKESSVQLRNRSVNFKSQLKTMLRSADQWKTDRDNYLSNITKKMTYLGRTIKDYSNHLKISRRNINENMDNNNKTIFNCEEHILKKHIYDAQYTLSVLNTIETAQKELKEYQKSMKTSGLKVNYIEVYDNITLLEVRDIANLISIYDGEDVKRDIKHLKTAKCTVLKEAIQNMVTGCQRYTQNLDIIWVSLAAIGIIAHAAVPLMFIMAAYHSPVKYLADSYRENSRNGNSGNQKHGRPHRRGKAQGKNGQRAYYWRR